VASTTTTVQTPTCRRKDFHDSMFRDYLQPIGFKTFFFCTTLKAGLHYGNYCSKLVHFGAQKIFFFVEKSPSLERLSP
jgi:hypothetical protein